MTRSDEKLYLTAASILTCLLVTAHGANPADFVFTNGKIYTVSAKQPWAEAVVVNGKEIAYVGDNEGAKSHVGAGTRSIDLKGRLLLPGFVESHIHIAGGAGTTSGAIIEASDSLNNVLRKVKEFAVAHPERKTVFGASYLASLFDAKGPRKELLDEIIPDRPVFLMDHTSHAVWVNSKTFGVAGITKDTKDPPGGEYVRGEDGELTGWIKGGPAHFPVLEAVEAISPESMMAALPNVLAGLSEFGFTAAIDMGMPFAAEAAYDALVNLDQEGKMPIRLSMTFYVNTPALAEVGVATLDTYAKRFKSEHVWFDTLKISIDSVIENQKAAMLEPYLTTGDRGSLYFDHESMKKMVLEAAGLGYHVTVHTIGDRAVREALDAAEVLREEGFRDTLYSTTHSQMVHPDDRPRYKKLNVSAQATGNWAIPQRGYTDLIGQERNDTLQVPFRTWADDGVNIALGADWPATPGGFENGINPFNNMYCAMHRRAPAHLREELGSYDATLPPVNEVLTLEECIEAYTIGGAKMLGIDDEIGSIAVGKKADMILLSQNLFEIDPENIPHTKVLATMFDGRIVHDVEYGLGDSNLTELDKIDRGIADGFCDDR